MTTIAFVDTEATSLDADTGEIWEVGLIVRDRYDHETEHRWLLPVTLKHADPISLGIGRFHERHPQGNTHVRLEHERMADLWDFTREFARLTDGAHLAGNVVSFDEERLRKLLRANGRMPSWHYHLVDVEALAAGKLGLAPPWDSRKLSEAIGVEPPSDEERHTALGDAAWAANIYDAVMAGAGS
jgi:oligoribonuclease (3'-5' exoribonuclease)